MNRTTRNIATAVGAVWAIGAVSLAGVAGAAFANTPERSGTCDSPAVNLTSNETVAAQAVTESSPAGRAIPLSQAFGTTYSETFPLDGSSGDTYTVIIDAAGTDVDRPLPRRPAPASVVTEDCVVTTPTSAPIPTAVTTPVMTTTDRPTTPTTVGSVVPVAPTPAVTVIPATPILAVATAPVAPTPPAPVVASVPASTTATTWSVTPVAVVHSAAAPQLASTGPAEGTVSMLAAGFLAVAAGAGVLSARRSRRA